MTLASTAAPADALAPLLLPENLQFTPEQFAAVCQANPNAVLELDADGYLIHMTPTGPRFQESCHPCDQYTRGLEDMSNASLQRGR